MTPAHHYETEADRRLFFPRNYRSSHFLPDAVALGGTVPIRTTRAGPRRDIGYGPSFRARHVIVR